MPGTEKPPPKMLPANDPAQQQDGYSRSRSLSKHMHSSRSLHLRSRYVEELSSPSDTWRTSDEELPLGYVEASAGEVSTGEVPTGEASAREVSAKQGISTKQGMSTKQGISTGEVSTKQGMSTNKQNQKISMEEAPTKQGTTQEVPTKKVSTMEAPAKQTKQDSTNEVISTNEVSTSEGSIGGALSSSGLRGRPLARER